MFGAGGVSTVQTGPALSDNRSPTDRRHDDGMFDVGDIYGGHFYFRRMTVTMSPAATKKSMLDEEDGVEAGTAAEDAVAAAPESVAEAEPLPTEN